MDSEQRSFEMEHFVEDMGLFVEHVGLPRMMGRVLGWLLIADPPYQTMQQMVDALHASKASISNSTRMLIEMGFVERTSLPGHRRDYYRLKSGVWYELTRRRMAQISAFRKLAERGLTLLDGKTPQLKTRLEEMQDVYLFFEKEFPPLLQRWEQQYQNNGSETGD